MKLKMTAAATMAMMASTIRISTAFTPKSINRRVVSNSFRVFSTIEDPIVADASSSIYEEQAEALAKVESPFLQIMRDRGFLHQCTNLEELDKNMMDKQTRVELLLPILDLMPQLTLFMLDPCCR